MNNFNLNQSNNATYLEYKRIDYAKIALALEDVLGAIPLQSLSPGRHPIVDMTDTLDGKVRLHLMSSGGEEYYTSAAERFSEIIKKNFDDYKKMGFEVNLCKKYMTVKRQIMLTLQD